MTWSEWDILVSKAIANLAILGARPSTWDANDYYEFDDAVLCLDHYASYVSGTPRGLALGPALLPPSFFDQFLHDPCFPYPAPSGPEQAFLTLLLAACALVSAPKPPPLPIIHRALDFFTDVGIKCYGLTLCPSRSLFLHLTQKEYEPGPLSGMVYGTSLRLVRLLLALPQLQTSYPKEGWMALNTASLWLSYGLGADYLGPERAYHGESQDGPGQRKQLELFAREAAEFIMICGRGFPAPEPATAPESFAALTSCCAMVSTLLKIVTREDMQGPLVDRYWELLIERIFPEQGPCFDIVPMLQRLSEHHRMSSSLLGNDFNDRLAALTAFASYSPFSPPNHVILVSAFLQNIALRPNFFLDVRVEGQIESLLGLLRHYMSLSATRLQDPDIQTESLIAYYNTLACYCHFADGLLFSGDICPSDLSKACGAALSDLVLVLISLPGFSDSLPEDCRAELMETVRNLWSNGISHIFAPLLSCPASRFHLMRVFLRSGALDRLRAAVKDQAAIVKTFGHYCAFPADLLRAHPNVSAVFRLSFDSKTGKDADAQLALMLLMLGNSRDRLFVRESSQLRLNLDTFMSAFSPPNFGLPDPLEIEHIPRFIATLFRFTSASRYSPNPGPAALDSWTDSTDLSPVISALDQAAEILSSRSARLSLLEIGDAVHALHGVMSRAAQEATDRCAKALEEQASVLAAMAAKRRIQERRVLKPRLEQLEGAIKGLESKRAVAVPRLLEWRDRLRDLGRRILREHLRLVEGTEAQDSEEGSAAVEVEA